MARLRDINVETKIKSVSDIFHSDIPVNDGVELSKYLEDCHTVIYKMLCPESLRNPNARSRYVNLDKEKLLRLRSSWENYIFDYHDELQEGKTINSKNINLHMLFWRNLCVLTAVIIRVCYNGKFQYVNARSNDYVRTNGLCISGKNIENYSMSDILLALRTFSARKWELKWSKDYVDYLIQLEFVIAQRISWITDNDELYDEGCSITKDGKRGISIGTTEYMAKWFYMNSKRIRERLILEKWINNEDKLELQIDKKAVAELHKLLRKTADSVHDPGRFFQPLKNFLLLCAVREGELDAYIREHGNKSASSKDILRENRPVNYLAHIEDDQFDVPKITDMLDTDDYTKQRFKEIIRLYLINLLFNITPGCKVNWLRFFVSFERDFKKNHQKIKTSRQPLLIQSFNEWYIYYDSSAWYGGDIASAFIGWIQLIRDCKDSKLHNHIDISPILDLLFFNPMEVDKNTSSDSESSEDEEECQMADCTAWI